MGIGVAVAAVAAGVGLAVNQAIRVRARRRLDAREALTDAEIYRRYYAATGVAPEAVAELWHEIAEALRVPPGKMRPEDVFGKDVGACWRKSRELETLRTQAARRAGAFGLAINTAPLKTVDAYVRAFAGGM